MVLDSQRARAESGRGGMSSGRRMSLKLPLVIVVIGVVIAVGWYMIKASGGTGSAAAETPQTAGPAAGPAAAPKPTLPAPAATDSGVSAATPAPQAPPMPAAPAPMADTPPAPAPQQPAGAAHAAADQPPLPQVAPDASDVTAPKVAEIIRQGRSQIQQNNLVAGRKLLNEALAGQIGVRDAEVVRQELAAVNQTLVFSPQVVKDDPYVEVHVVKSGELLATIAPAYHVPWQFMAKINNISDPRLLRVGARLKAIKGPFHVVVHKEAFRADVYLDPVDANSQPMFVRSFPVALGAYDSTPLGTFVVRRHSKLIDPEWVNPRTGQRFASNDPNNPIGEYWIGLEGTDDATRDLRGYGLHGTIDPSSIGKQASMGCVRFLPADIELLYSMLTETESRVSIREE